MRISITEPMHWLGNIAGLVIITLALMSVASLELSEIFERFSSVISVVGWPFLTIYSVLTAILLGSYLKIRRARREGSSENLSYWAQVGTQVCGLLSTMALVFTLFGLSQGVLLLGVSKVTPDSIDQLLGELMTHFGVAFYSSIIGLPTAALGRFVIFTTSARPVNLKKENRHAISF